MHRAAAPTTSGADDERCIAIRRDFYLSPTYDDSYLCRIQALLVPSISDSGITD